MPGSDVVAPERAQLDLGLGGGSAEFPQGAGVLERGDRAMAGEGTAVVAGELARLERDRKHLPLRDPDLDPPARQVRIERVVVRVDAQVRIGWHAGDEAAVDVGHRRRQRPHRLELLGQTVCRAAAQGAVEADVRPLVEPAIELVLEVELVQEAAPGLEARLDEALQALDRALRLRIARLQEVPAERELAQEGGEGLARPACAGVQRSLAVPDERLGQRAELLEAAPDPVQEVGRFLGEDERAGSNPGVGKAADDHVAAPGLAVANRDLVARLPQVELAEHARAVARALEGARSGQEERAQLAQVVVQDRLASRVALLCDQLADPPAGQTGVVAKQPPDLLRERLELRGPARAAVAGRLARAQRPADGVAITPGRARDLLDRQPGDEVHPPDLRPLLHPDHVLLLTSASLTGPGSWPRRTALRRPGGDF
jgi:hypothetical protein